MTIGFLSSCSLMLPCRCVNSIINNSTMNMAEVIMFPLYNNLRLADDSPEKLKIPLNELMII